VYKYYLSGGNTGILNASAYQIENVPVVEIYCLSWPEIVLSVNGQVVILKLDSDPAMVCLPTLKILTWPPTPPPVGSTREAIPLPFPTEHEGAAAEFSIHSQGTMSHPCVLYCRIPVLSIHPPSVG
jgi:hypothetical protein